MPATGAWITSPGVDVIGSGPADAGPLRISVALGSVVLGETVVVAAGGTFHAELPVMAPRNTPPLDASIRVAETTEPGVVLLERPVRLIAAPPVTIDDVRSQARQGRRVAEVRGTAATSLRAVTVVFIEDRSRTTLDAFVTPVRDPGLVEAARLLSVGAWRATVQLSPEVRRILVLVRWPDGTLAGGVSSAQLTLEEPPPSD